jgi:maltose acetyltransferase-like protein
MLAGELYRPGAPEIQEDQAATKNWLLRYNAAVELPGDVRRYLPTARAIRRNAVRDLNSDNRSGLAGMSGSVVAP